MELNELQKLLYQEYTKNGYAEMWQGEEDGKPSTLKRRSIAAIFLLWPSLQKLSDSAENCRNGVTADLETKSLHETDFEKVSVVAELILIATEINEAVEAILAGEDPSKEYSDIVIRTLNAYTRATGKNLEDVIVEKHHINLSRKHLHGRVI